MIKTEIVVQCSGDGWSENFYKQTAMPFVPQIGSVIWIDHDDLMDDKVVGVDWWESHPEWVRVAINAWECDGTEKEETEWLAQIGFTTKSILEKRPTEPTDSACCNEGPQTERS